MAWKVECEILGLNLRTALNTPMLEECRGEWNSLCSSEMRRYREEDQLRRRLSGHLLTLRHEG